MTRTIRNVKIPVLPKRSYKPVTAEEKVVERERAAILARFGACLDDLDINAIHKRMYAKKRPASIIEYRTGRGTTWREGIIKPRRGNKNANAEGRDHNPVGAERYARGEG